MDDAFHRLDGACQRSCVRLDLIFMLGVVKAAGEHDIELAHVRFPPNRGGLGYAASRSEAAVFS